MKLLQKGEYIHQMVVCDLDGTLLNDQGEITPYTKRVISEIAKRVPVILATARPIRDTIFYLNNLGLTTPSIHCNGAVIYSNTHKKVIYSNPIHSNHAKKLLALLYNSNQMYHCWAEKNDSYWILSDKDDDIKRWMSFGTKPIAKGYPNPFFNGHLDKFLVYGKNEKIIKLIDQEFYDQLIYTYSDSKKKWLEILSKSAGKASSIQVLADYFNIAVEKIIAFGDADNDLDMLEMVGMGVAMGNAPSYIKSKADAVTLSNLEDGVARYLARVFNISTI